ncbi:YdiU family protein [Rhodoblastus acidophilus]|uniref:Protein nucleotidyltransferase YdiU n=1 Tax=Rhodoblastus acidophilus TaxID=1074 RepID=A0A6N8DPZ6_RHOAC|nr:YdiU family protein [Rhodoblastus acidophilus]MCW2274995.1 uncharacterized protein YdiU (UPF0061 family) [Rhodoblastus acidophilus]MTV31273.1 YdiU family protein [Rhodoblastus acidophilus]
MGAEIPFRESFYLGLPSDFYKAAQPSPPPAPHWVVFNERLARELGLPQDADTPELLNLLSGGAPPNGSSNVALAYSGHQFGVWNPLMGDGRAVIVGEVAAPDGHVYDIHLKGSGPTPFARRGDGRATLSAMLREYLVSEAMAGLKIPTTRSLAVAATGAPVFRDGARPGAVLTRVARSHIRVGTFQYAAGRDATEELGPVRVQALADAAIRRHEPDLAQAEQPYLEFYRAVVARQAGLIAQWMLVGFIHGVMNSDNMAISGETIDFGPCAFMDSFNMRQVYSSIDAAGRYAYKNQPSIAQWNLARLAESLLPLFHNDEATALRLAQEALATFPSLYAQNLAAGLTRKLGLRPGDPDNEQVIALLWKTLGETRADFTNFFVRLTEMAEGLDVAPDETWAPFMEPWRAALGKNDKTEALAAMRVSNPRIIPRNHRVEQALAAANEGNLKPFHRLCAALQNPFERAPGNADLQAPPKPEEVVHETFCGT